MMTRESDEVSRHAARVAPDVWGALRRWAEGSTRKFPWRVSARGERRLRRDPWTVLVSEIMLQQTQADRVAVRLPEFLALFPTPERLAAARRDEVIRAWRGMGYNNRAIRLHEAARKIAEEYNGAVPGELSSLLALPGIGRYTAHAVLSFAFNMDVPVVDVNIQRTLSRLFHRCHAANVMLPEPTVERLDAKIVPDGEGAAWHEALMDLGATVCTARSPKCRECPVGEWCLSMERMGATLFDPASERIEPAVLGLPRRLWRGRVVELLRNVGEGTSVADLVGTLSETHAPGGLDELNSAMADLLGGLMRDGVVERVGVGEPGGGTLLPGDLVRLRR